jgi:hypothetical protein
MEEKSINIEVETSKIRNNQTKILKLAICWGIIFAIVLGSFIYLYTNDFFRKVSSDGYTPTQLVKHCDAKKKCSTSEVTLQGDLKNISNDYRRYQILDNKSVVSFDLPTSTTLLERVLFAEKNKVIFGASHIKVTAIAYYEEHETPGLGVSSSIKMTSNPGSVIYLGEKTTSDKILGQQGMGNLIAGYDESFKLSDAIMLFDSSGLSGKIRAGDISSPNSGYRITRPDDAPYNSEKSSWNFMLMGNGTKGEFASDSYYMTVTKNNITIYQNYWGSLSLQNGDAKVIESLDF